MLEANVSLSETVRSNAKFCIRGYHQSGIYTLAISTYAYYLVGWKDEADRSFQRLLDITKKENNLMWWSQSGIKYVAVFAYGCIRLCAHIRVTFDLPTCGYCTSSTNLLIHI